MTILLTTHLLDEAERLCDRLGILKQGCLLAEGSLAALRHHIAAQEIVVVQTAAEDTAIALAMQQNIKIQAIADLVLPSSSLAAIIQQTAAEWHRLRLEQNTRLQDFLEGFFNWRRSVN